MPAALYRPALLAAALVAALCGGVPLPAAADTAGGAVPAAAVPGPKATQLGLYLHPREALALMSGPEAAKTLFIDVRAPEEVMFVGMPELADANVPYSVVSPTGEFDQSRRSFKMEPYSGFATAIEQRLKAKGLTRQDRVILICRSGDRSARAANLLAQAGYTQVYTVLEGFEGDMGKGGRRDVNGWKNDGLPWSYALDPAKLTEMR